MDPTIPALLFLLLFAATHIGLAAPPLRRALVARLGERGFVWAFTAVASATFSLTVWWYAGHAGLGAAGLALGANPLGRGLLMTASVVGIVLMAGSLAEYGRTPYALSGGNRAPRGLARVTRHGFFAGLTLLGAAHALLATRLIGALLMGGLACIAALGARFQDRKLLVLRGEPYAAYLAATSAVPFAAILAGRQRLVWRELPFAGMAIGLAAAYLLRAYHGGIFAHGGAWVILAVVGGALLILVSETLRGRRVAATRPQHTT